MSIVTKGFGSNCIVTKGYGWTGLPGEEEPEPEIQPLYAVPISPGGGHIQAKPHVARAAAMFSASILSHVRGMADLSARLTSGVGQQHAIPISALERTAAWKPLTARTLGQIEGSEQVRLQLLQPSMIDHNVGLRIAEMSRKKGRLGIKVTQEAAQEYLFETMLAQKASSSSLASVTLIEPRQRMYLRYLAQLEALDT